MKDEKVNALSSLILLLNFVLLLCLFAFGYLVFGDYIAHWAEEKPVIAQKSGGSARMAEDDFDKVVDGIHLASGLVYAPGFEVVRGNCTACHSAKLITQNRATREGWEQMIRWMQKTQGLWELGTNEPIILDYLAAHYAPEEIGRRANIDLEAVEWYILNIEE